MLYQKGKEAFYLPSHLLVTKANKGFNFRTEPYILERAQRYIQNGKFDPDNLEKKLGWKVFKISVSKKDHRKLRNLIQVNDKKAFFCAVNIFEKAQNDVNFFYSNDSPNNICLIDSSLDSLENRIPTSFDYNPDSVFEENYSPEDPLGDEEDYHDDWWKRGDAPPEFDSD